MDFTKDILKRVAIVGYGEAKFERRSEKSVVDLCADACVEAIKQSGIEKNEIDGLLGTPAYLAPQGPNFELEPTSKVSDYLGIRPKLSTTMDAGGVSAYNQMLFASLAIASGYVNTVLCVSGGKFRSGPHVRMAAHPEFELPYGADIISFYALPAVRHMYQYGTTESQIASVVVSQRKWAAMNPNAIFWEPVEVEDVLNSPPVVYPYRLLMCSRPADGAGAVLLTSTQRAKQLTDAPLYILGVGEHHTHGWVISMPNLTELGSKVTAEKAFEMAGLTPKDISVAMFTDPFAFLPIEHLEDCGFVPKGEGGRFFEEGRSHPGGELPVNTHGGLLCGVHDGVSPIIHHVIEAIRQLTGRAGKRQVKNADKAFIQFHGGMMQHHASLILGR
jgi:acetyl-CoA acetyltransferase